MPLGSRFTINHSEVQSYLDGAHGVEEMIRSHAERVLAAAKDSAPVESGKYRDSLQLVEDHTDRLVIRVASDVAYVWVVEANTGNLARALDSA